MLDNKKDIDAVWKEAVKKGINYPNDEKNKIPETPDFKFCITSFALQAAIFLGAIENPVTNMKEENLPQAKLIIDTLDMLKQKTQGNLLSEEASILDNLLCELKTQYITKTNK